MSILVRKINKAKWLQKDLTIDRDVSADAITNCLKTQKNTLSVWEIKNEQDINQSVLAIAASLDHLESIDVILMDGKYLIKANIEINSTSGNTKVNDLVDIHKDLCNLTYSKLGTITDHIVDSINADKLKRYTKKDLKDILLEAINDKRLKKEDLPDSIKEKL